MFNNLWNRNSFHCEKKYDEQYLKTIIEKKKSNDKDIFYSYIEFNDEIIASGRQDYLITIWED